MFSNTARTIRRVAVLGLLGLLVGAPAALAQTTTTEPYPGNPTTIPAAPTSADVDYGPQETGGVLNVTQCNYLPGSSASTTIFHEFGSTTLATPSIGDVRGCFVEHIEVLPTLVALGHGRFVFAATGRAATGTKVQIKVNGQTITVGPYGTVVTSVSTGTGANGAPRTTSFKFTVVKRGTIRRSGLVRTGTTVARWAPFGLGLLGIGYLLSLATRRRRNAEA